MGTGSEGQNSGDGERVCGVGVGMGTGTMGTDGDGDQFLSPCSSLPPNLILHRAAKILRPSLNAITKPVIAITKFHQLILKSRNI